MNNPIPDVGKVGQIAYSAIGREIAKEIEKVFEAKVNPETLRSRARKISGSIYPSPITPYPDNEIQENQDEPGYQWDSDRQQWKPSAARFMEVLLNTTLVMSHIYTSTMGTHTAGS